MTWRTMSVATLAAVMAFIGASCQTGVQMWTGCAIAADGNRSGTDGTYVLECRNGEWVPVLTVDEFVRAARGEEFTIAPVPTRPAAPTATATTTTVVDPWVELEGSCFAHVLVNYNDLLFVGPINTLDNAVEYSSGSNCTIPKPPEDTEQTFTAVGAPDVATATQVCTTLGYTGAFQPSYPTFPDDGWFCSPA